MESTPVNSLSRNASFFRVTVLRVDFCPAKQEPASARAKFPKVGEALSPSGSNLQDSRDLMTGNGYEWRVGKRRTYVSEGGPRGRGPSRKFIRVHPRDSREVRASVFRLAMRRPAGLSAPAWDARE